MLALQDVKICSDCFTVTGPSNATVDYFNLANNANSSYHLSVSWDESYLGPVSVAVDSAL